MKRWIVGDHGFFSDRLYQPGDVIERPDDWKPKPGMRPFDPASPPVKAAPPADEPLTMSDLHQRQRPTKPAKPVRAADSEPI
jgi:hypothetical protein